MFGKAALRIALLPFLTAIVCGMRIDNVRINSQSPSWDSSCPPAYPWLPSAPPCEETPFSLGLPTTDIRITWVLVASLPSSAPRGVLQVSYEAEIYESNSWKLVWSSGNVSPRRR